MLAHSSVWRFALHLLLLYGLLAAPWPGLKHAYGSLFRACGNQLFGSFGTTRTVDFRPPAAEHAEWDVEVYFKDRDRSGGLHMEYSSRGWGYLPTAAVVALILATPLPWSRRVSALFWGLVLVQVFVVLRVFISLFYGFYWGGSLDPGRFWGKMLEMLLFAFSDSPVASFVVPVVIWLLVSFPRDDWEKFIRGQAESRTGSM